MKTHFYNTVLSKLRRTSDSTWELTEPHLLYLDSAQSEDYLKVMQDKNYSTGFHNDTVELIESHLPDLFPHSTDISIIDLGPGYPDKSLPMAKFLKNRGQHVFYYPVDVSADYLKISEEAMRPFCQSIVPIQSLFETASQKINAEAYQKKVFVLIGLTFMNFPSQDIIKLLKSLSGPNGHVLFASELISEINSTEKIVSAYQGDAMRAFTFGPLKHLGFHEDQVTFKPIFQNQRVENRFHILEALPGLDIKAFDTVVTAVSYRYTIQDLSHLTDVNFKNKKIWISKSSKTALVEAWDEK